MREEIIRRILQIVRAQAASAGFGLSTDLEEQLRTLITSGVDRTRMTDLVDPQKLVEAERNARYLAELLIQDAQQRRLTESLNAGGLPNIIAGFCPRFPIC